MLIVPDLAHLVIGLVDSQLAGPDGAVGGRVAGVLEVGSVGGGALATAP